MAEGLHRRYSGICKRGINFLSEKDTVAALEEIQAGDNFK